jgi:ribosomal protein L11 methyltransferase
MRAFVVVVSEPDVEAASDVLWQLGVRAIEERRAGVPQEVELWTAVGDESEAIERAVTALGDRWPHRVVDVADVAADTWRDFAVPMQVSDDLVVVPAWLDEVASAANTAANRTVVRIEPGGAFGLGDHPTTMLSLRALHRLVASDTDVLDVGCGTGVIAVTAAILQDRPVRAIDIAAAAVEATIDNADRNGVGNRVVVDTSDLAQIDDTFDLVVANILAPVLISLGADLRRVTRPAGRLVISGILADSHQHVLDALAPMQVVRTDVLDGWACVELRFG